MPRKPRSMVPVEVVLPFAERRSTCRRSLRFSLISSLTMPFSESTSSAPPTRRRRVEAVPLLVLRRVYLRFGRAVLAVSSAISHPLQKSCQERKQYRADFGICYAAAGIVIAGCCLIRLFNPSRANSCAGLAFLLTYLTTRCPRRQRSRTSCTANLKVSLDGIRLRTTGAQSVRTTTRCSGQREAARSSAAAQTCASSCADPPPCANPKDSVYRVRPRTKTARPHPARPFLSSAAST